MVNLVLLVHEKVDEYVGEIELLGLEVDDVADVFEGVQVIGVENKDITDVAGVVFVVGGKVCEDVKDVVDLDLVIGEEINVVTFHRPGRISA